MAFTMHSHSGQFCPGHAKDQLEDIIQHAIRVGYKTMGLTEHMPRTDLSDLYPEELHDPEGSLAVLGPRHAAYLAEAQRLQAKYAEQIHLLIGFEGEWIRPAYAGLVRELAAPACIDYFIGSVHHAGGIPIDFDKPTYVRAMRACGGTEEAMYASYYDDQLAMLQALKPRVVGHFDLIRLMSEEPGRELRAWGNGGVWEKVVRNLEYVASYGGWLECNTAALRKGLAEPYPSREIAEQWIKLGGGFTMSDDSHGIAQVATNYVRGLDYLEALGVTSVWTWERKAHVGVAKGMKSELIEKKVPLTEFRASLKPE